MPKILPKKNDIKCACMKLKSDKKTISLMPIKNYSQYLREYGLKPLK